MITLSSFTATTTHHPDLIYARWTDPSTWSQWDPEVRSASIDGEAVVGARGRLRPRSGPASSFVITDAIPGKVFTNTGSFPGAKLDVVHRCEADQQGGGRITVAVRLRGPLSPLWKRIIGPGMADAARSSGEGLLAFLGKDAR